MLNKENSVYLSKNIEEAVGSEVEALRDRYSKHFNLGGGRYQAITSACPIHYQDEDGKWAEIDSRLIEDKDRGRLRTRAGDATISLAKRADASRLVSIEHKGKTLSWRFENARVAAFVEAVADCDANAAQQKRTVSALSAQEQRIRSFTKTSRMTYGKILDGVSVTYDIDGGAVKESIVIENSKALKDATILLPNEFDYQLRDDQGIEVRDQASGEELFRFAPPVAWDSSEAQEKHGATISLESGNGNTRLKYILDEEYLKTAVFPVTIDPIVVPTLTDQNIDDTYIWAANKNTNYGGVHLMRCGEGDGGTSIGLVRFKKLVKQRASDTITYAALRLYPENYLSETEYMAVYPITAEWNESTATWNNPAVDSSITLSEFISPDMLDFVTTTYVAYQHFDITNLYRQWYELDENNETRNFGIAIKYPADTSVSRYIEYSASTYAPSTAPKMVVNYVSHAGKAGWWQYEDQGIGRGGTASVDLFNGNLVYTHQDTAMNGNRMPVSIAHTYNSCLSSSNEVGCGMGWRTSAHQSMYKTTISDVTYYVWTDGGGTEHWFEVSGTSPYEDQEGMKLKLKVQTETVTIEDKGHNVMTFGKPSNETKKYIQKIKDSCDSEVLYEFTDNILNTVTDGAGRITTYSYTNSLLSSITAPGCPVVSFAYDGDKLASISYSDLTSGGTTFAYDGTTNMLASATNFDGVSVNLTYTPEGKFDPSCVQDYAAQQRKVTSMELKNGTVSGAKRTFDYGGCITKVTVAEDTSSNDGKTLTYQFNDAGNVVCVTDEMGFAQFTKFSSGFENTPSASSKMQKAVINKLPNIDFRSKWASYGTGETFSRTTATGYTCLSMASSQVTKTISGESTYRSYAPLQWDGTYTLSAYVKTDGITGSGAFLRAVANGQKYESRKISTSTAELSGGPMADGWERISVTFPFAYGTSDNFVQVSLVVSGTAGTANFSCPQLEEGVVANRVNLLVNGDFTLTHDSVGRVFPDTWTKGTNITSSTLNGVMTENHGMPDALKGNALRMVSKPSLGSIRFLQEVNVSGAEDDVFVVGGWCDSKSVAYGAGTNSTPLIGIQFYNSANDEWSDWTKNSFNREWIGWQFGSWAAVAPTAYTKVRVCVQYSRNSGTCKFSNIYLHREQFGQSYAYDEDKNVTSTTVLSGEKSSMEYDDFDNLISYIRPGDAGTNEYVMTYGSDDTEKKQHLLRTVTTPEGLKTTHTYDSHGNPTGTINQKTPSLPGIGSKTDYNTGVLYESGNYAISITDARGNTIEKSVNETTGLTESVTDPVNTTVNYTYDDSKRTTEVSCTTDSKTYKNAYTYENDRIKTVSHNTTDNTATDVTYTFGYDALGRKTSVQVGTQTLSTNVYETDRTGLLSEVQYGNGGNVQNTYDDFDRLTGITYDNATTPRFQYEYGANGRVVCMTDTERDEFVTYDNDLAERPLQRTVHDGTTGDILYRSTLKYDQMNQVESFTENIGSDSRYETSYTYDNDGRTTQVEFGDETRMVSYDYDDVGRIDSRTVTNGTGNTYSTDYTFVTGSTAVVEYNPTTPLVSSIVQAGMNLSYAYDNRGNIISETRNGLVTNYEYDGMGQLTRVNDPNDLRGSTLGTIWEYAYDRGGNMTSASMYTNETTPTLVETKTMTYGDGNWKDKLTAVGSHEITYDAIGNMLADGTHINDWEHGRQLKRVTMYTDAVDGECMEDGYDAASGATSHIVFTDGNRTVSGTETATATVMVVHDGVDITSALPASSFTWTLDSGRSTEDAAWNAAHLGVKQVTLTAADMNGNVQLACSVQSGASTFGFITLDSDENIVSYTRSEEDADDTLSLSTGFLSVSTPDGNVYSLDDGALKVETDFFGTVIASATVFAESPARTVELSYNLDGMRAEKKVTILGDEITTYYTYSGTKLTHLACGNDSLHFFYDAQGRPAIVHYDNGSTMDKYTYVHNLQGDIVGILDSSGTLVVEYKYDAWGKPISMTGTIATILGKLNPFRYRGYVYDEETGYYYLRSRYYDPELRRFVNSDASLQSRKCLGYNGFLYCLNNPVVSSDPTGDTDYYVVIIRAYVPKIGETWVGHYEIQIIGTITIGSGDSKREYINPTISYEGKEGKTAKIRIFDESYESDVRGRAADSRGSYSVYEVSSDASDGQISDLENYLSNNLTFKESEATGVDKYTASGNFAIYTRPGGNTCFTFAKELCAKMQIDWFDDITPRDITNWYHYTPKLIRVWIENNMNKVGDY